MNRLLSDKRCPFPAHSTVVMLLNSAIRLAFQSLHHWLAVWPMSSSLVSFDLDFLKKGDLQIHEMSGDLCLLFQSLGCISCDVSKIAFLCLSLYFSASSVSFFPSIPFILVGKSVLTSSTSNSLRIISLFSSWAFHSSFSLWHYSWKYA